MLSSRKKRIRVFENAGGRCDDGGEWWRDRKGCNFKWAGQGLIDKMRFELTLADLKEVRELAIWISERSFIGREDSQYKVLKVAVCFVHSRDSCNPLCLEQRSETKRNRRWDQRNNRLRSLWTLWASLWLWFLLWVKWETYAGFWTESDMIWLRLYRITLAAMLRIDCRGCKD